MMSWLGIVFTLTEDGVLSRGRAASQDQYLQLRVHRILRTADAMVNTSVTVYRDIYYVRGASRPTFNKAVQTDATPHPTFSLSTKLTKY